MTQNLTAPSPDQISAVRQRIQDLIAEEGLTLKEVFPRLKRKGIRGPKQGSKVAPKYRNPAQPDQTWSGRGKVANWVRAYESAGRDRVEFLIP